METDRRRFRKRICKISYLTYQVICVLVLRSFKQYKLKGCLNKKCCKQCRYVKFKGTMTKWPVQKLTHTTTQKHLQHHEVTNI